MNRIGKISFLLSLVIILVTLGLKVALSGWMPFFTLGFGFGIFFMVFAVLMNLGFFRSLIHSESLKFLLQTSLTIFISLIILLCLNYILFKKVKGIDITADKIHSLSELTQGLVKAINQDVHFVYFHADNERVKNFESLVKNEIQRYSNLNNHIHFESHSIFKRPDLAAEFKVGQEESSLFAKYKDRIERVNDITEIEITNALLKLTKPMKKIYFVEGHGERKSQDESTFGLSGLIKELTRLHYQVDKLEKLIEIPKDAIILVLAGPQKALEPQEINQLEHFLQKGGSLLLAIDPKASHGLNDFLKKYSIQTKDQFVFSDQTQVGQSALLVPTYKSPDSNEVTKSLEEGQNPYFFISTVLEIINNQNKSIKISPLLEHLPTSIGRNDLVETSDIVSQGRQIAAVLVQGIITPFRFIILGDSDFMTNQFYVRDGNFDFSMGLFTYLSKDEDLSKLKTRIPQTTYLLLSQTQLNIYFIFFVIPFMSLFFIVAIFFRLRRFF
jgi:ABC-type uncharacterized transport system involved in gliding motility auxiliary subunit